MAVTAEQFLVDFPDFVPLHAEDNALVDAALRRAEARIGSAWPDAVRNDIVMLQAAEFLARSPAGRAARLSKPGKPTAYGDDLKMRKMAMACGRSRTI